MSVFQNRPYERHMVTNIPTLLASGTILDLAVGQLGIFDARTNQAVVAPTYANNKTIYIAQGTPDRSNFVEGAGVPNMVRRTHNIQGKKLISLRGKKASRGQSEIVTIGYDGVDTTKTLTGKPGQTKYYWVRLTGDPIFNLNPDYQKGVIIQGAIQLPCEEECEDNCTLVDCNFIADAIVKDFNTKLLPGGSPVTKYVNAVKLSSCTDDPTLTLLEYETYCVTVPDGGSAEGLGLLQAQYPGKHVTKTGSSGIFSTYCFTQLESLGAPAAYVQGPGSVIPNCAVCPTGFTSSGPLTMFQVRLQQANGTSQAAAIDAALEAGLVGFDFTVTLLQYEAEVGTATYQVLATLNAGTPTTAGAINTVLTAASIPSTTELIGTVSQACVNNGSVTYAWTLSPEVCNRVQVQFTITLNDDICGNNFLTQLQAAYANIAVDGAVVAGTVAITTAGDCANVYTLTTYSDNCVPEGCTAEQVVFPTIPAFNGSEWTPVPLAEGTGCVCGVQFSSVYVPRVTREATFDQFAYQTDFVHIEISMHNPDWRSIDICEQDPIVTRTQNGAYPNGAGQAVARLEKQDRMYDMDYFYMSPVLREAFDFYFETKFDQYYDMVAVEYEFEYASNNGFGQFDRDRYVQYFWLPETQATALITALNTYAASANINIDPIVL